MVDQAKQAQWFMRGNDYYLNGNKVGADELRKAGVNDEALSKAADRQNKLNSFASNTLSKYDLSKASANDISDQINKMANLASQAASSTYGGAVHRAVGASDYDDWLNKVSGGYNRYGEALNSLDMYDKLGLGDMSEADKKKAQELSESNEKQNRFNEASEAGDVQGLGEQLYDAYNGKTNNNLVNRFNTRVGATGDAFQRGDWGHGIAGGINAATGTVGDAVSTGVQTALTPLNLLAQGLGYGIGAIGDQIAGTNDKAKNWGRNAKGFLTGFESFPGGLISDVGNVATDIADAGIGTDMTGRQLTNAERWGRVGDAALKTALDASMFVNPAAGAARAALAVGGKELGTSIGKKVLSDVVKNAAKSGVKLGEGEAEALAKQQLAGLAEGGKVFGNVKPAVGRVAEMAKGDRSGVGKAVGSQLKGFNEAISPHNYIQFSPTGNVAQALFSKAPIRGATQFMGSGKGIAAQIGLGQGLSAVPMPGNGEIDQLTGKPISLAEMFNRGGGATEGTSFNKNMDMDAVTRYRMAQEAATDPSRFLEIQNEALLKKKENGFPVYTEEQLKELESTPEFQAMMKTPVVTTQENGTAVNPYLKFDPSQGLTDLSNEKYQNAATPWINMAANMGVPIGVAAVGANMSPNRTSVGNIIKGFTRR